MSARYLTRSDLQSLLRESCDPLAEPASAALDPMNMELLPVHSGGLDTATYEVRLARAETGEGPTTVGLRRFVEALKLPMTEAETIGFRGTNGTQYIVLLDRGHVAAITAIGSP